MKTKFLRLGALILALVLAAALATPAFAQGSAQKATILFTHDLHSHLLPAAKDDGGEYGGYARLMTVIREQKARNPEALLLDGGDFSMGSLFQTAYPTAALELRIMGAMGYDATVFGNHEFDYLPKGIAGMLHAAVDSGDRVPMVLNGNYLPPLEGTEGYTQDSKLVWEAFAAYGVEEYTLLERGGVYFAIIGLTGINSDECAPNSGMILEDPAVAAQRLVDEATAKCVEEYGMEPVVIVLSHGGTEDGAGEDVALAEAVTGIDVIVSGHSHTTLKAPIMVGQTAVVSAGYYGNHLGVLELEIQDGSVGVADYELIAIDETVADDPEIGALVEQFKRDVEIHYLASYDMKFDQVLTHNPYEFEKSGELYAYAHESTLGNVYSDAYRWAASLALKETVDVALTASGVVRESIPLGDVTVSDVFNAASLGVGTEGELVGIWLTGRDLKQALEVDASIYPLMHSAQLFYSGVEYSFNTNRMIFNKIDYAALRREDGTTEKIQDNKLYRVVCGMYMGQMLGNVEKTSYGLLSITPRDREGNPIEVSRLVDYVIRNDEGVALKEWYAIASYLQAMGGQMDPQYAQTDGRKVVYASWNPVKLLQNANRFTYLLLAVVVLLVLLVVGMVKLGRKLLRRKKK